jgi:hypothetical protein
MNARHDPLCGGKTERRETGQMDLSRLLVWMERKVSERVEPLGVQSIRLTFIAIAVVIGLTSCTPAHLTSTESYGKAISAKCEPGGWSPDRMTVTTTIGVVTLNGCHSFKLGEDVWVNRYDDGWPGGKQCWFYSASTSLPCAR